MSDIDLWDDDITVEVPESPPVAETPLGILLLAAPQYAGEWRQALQAEGVQLLPGDSHEIDLVLVDERDSDFTETLERLRASEAAQRPAIFFLLASGTQPDCMRAFEAGADDYLLLPVAPAALAARLKLSHQRYREDSQLRQQLAQSSQIAFQSMSLNAELGRILQYMETSFACQQFATLAQLTLEILHELGLHCSLGIFHDRGLEYFCDDGIKRPIEQEVIENSRHLGRISDFAARTILNYPHVGLLVRNMPLDDPLRYGILKDHLCYIGNGLEARCQAMITEHQARERAVRIQTTASVLQQMIAEMEQAKLEVTRRSTEELQGMLDALHHEFSQLCLTGSEEDTLMSLLSESSDRIHALFSNAAEQDQLFQSLLSEVAKTLEH